MERPQQLWMGRGVKRHIVGIFRWRPNYLRVERRYHTLDVDREDEDNFFAVTGRLNEEPAWQETMTRAQYDRVHVVEWRKRNRIRIYAATVELWLQLKKWKTRYRHASGDLEFAFEPYRKRLWEKAAKMGVTKEYVEAHPDKVRFESRGRIYSGAFLLGIRERSRHDRLRKEIMEEDSQ